MPNFNLPMPNLASSGAKATNAELGAIKIQMGQMYNARVEILSKQSAQLSINIGQQVVNQPLPQLPNQIRPGQNYQVAVTLNKNGQPVVQFFQGQNQQAISTVKVNLSDAQIVSLLTLNKQYQAQPGGSVQTTATVVLDGQSKTPSLQLPGLNTPIKLPPELAAKLSAKQPVKVTISSTNGKMTLALQAQSPSGTKVSGQIPLTADKAQAIVKQAISQSHTQGQPMAVKVEAKPQSPSKIVLPQGQVVQLPNKVSANTTANISALSQRQLSLALTATDTNTQTPQLKATDAKILATLPLSKETLTPAIKAALGRVSADPAPSNDRADKTQPQPAASETAKVNLGSLKGQTDNPLIAAAKQLDPGNKIAPMPMNQEVVANRVEQKQALDKLIEPLVRLLLPKKIDWSEGLKNLSAIEKQLAQQPPAQAKGGDDLQATPKLPELKQILSELRNSIPDHNTPLTDKRIANILGTIVNFNPTTVNPQPQPTPANAIANALQLLFGAKLVQSDAKVTPQVIQQLTALLKGQVDKDDKSPKNMKTLTASLAQSDQSSGSLRSLVGLGSTMRHQQLENAEKKLDGNPQLNITMPLKVDDEIKELSLTINEDEETAKKGGHKVSIWQLNLTFDLGDLGKMLVSAKLKEGEVTMQMYAEKALALRQIEKFSDTLEQRLVFHGVKVDKIQSSLGKIQSNNDNRKLTSLLQIKV